MTRDFTVQIDHRPSGPGSSFRKTGSSHSEGASVCKEGTETRMDGISGFYFFRVCQTRVGRVINGSLCIQRTRARGIGGICCLSSLRVNSLAGGSVCTPWKTSHTFCNTWSGAPCTSRSQSTRASRAPFERRSGSRRESLQCGPTPISCCRTGPGSVLRPSC